jgi:hypothetical protein
MPLCSKISHELEGTTTKLYNESKTHSSNLYNQFSVAYIVQIFKEYSVCGTVDIISVDNYIHTLLSKWRVTEETPAFVGSACSSKVVAIGDAYTSSLMYP